MVQSEKLLFLKDQGGLNRHPGKIKEPLFHSNPFFDPNDLVQVKYEMVRQVRKDGKSVSESAAAFGMSRPSFYLAQDALEREGVLGLAPKKTGPKNRHKLSPQIMTFVKDCLEHDCTISLAMVSELVQKKFSITVHQRSIERALAAQKKMPSIVPSR